MKNLNTKRESTIFGLQKEIKETKEEIKDLKNRVQILDLENYKQLSEGKESDKKEASMNNIL